MATSEVGVGQVSVEELRKQIETEYQTRFEVWKTKELANLQEEQNRTIEEEIQKLYKKIQDEQKPLTKEEIQTLVDQEYAEIPIKVSVEGEDGERKVIDFMIRELPQSVERKFYRQFKTRLKDKGSELAAFTQVNRERPMEEQLMSFMETFDGAFDVLADAIVLILNPRGNKDWLTTEWVANNLSSNRMYSIILAQVEVNKLRDFFSRLFQSGQRATTLVTPPNMDQLRQLAR